MNKTEAREHLRNIRNFLRYRKTKSEKAELMKAFYKGTTWEETVKKYPEETAAACVDLAEEAMGEAIKALEQRENEDRQADGRKCTPVCGAHKPNKFLSRCLARIHQREGKKRVHHR